MPRPDVRVFWQRPTQVFTGASDPRQGWQKLPYGPVLDPRTTCISTNPQSTEDYLGWYSQRQVSWSRAMAEKAGDRLTGFQRDIPVNTIAQDPHRPDYVYVGTKQSFYMSHDGGVTGVGVAVICRLAISPAF